MGGVILPPRFRIPRFFTVNQRRLRCVISPTKAIRLRVTVVGSGMVNPRYAISCNGVFRSVGKIFFEERAAAEVIGVVATGVGIVCPDVSLCIITRPFICTPEKPLGCPFECASLIVVHVFVDVTGNFQMSGIRYLVGRVTVSRIFRSYSSVGKRFFCIVFPSVTAVVIVIACLRLGENSVVALPILDGVCRSMQPAHV